MKQAISAFLSKDLHEMACHADCLMVDFKDKLVTVAAVGESSPGLIVAVSSMDQVPVSLPYSLGFLQQADLYVGGPAQFQ